SSPIVEWEQLESSDVTKKNLEISLSSLCHFTSSGTLEDRGLLLQNELTRVWRGKSREPAQYYYDVTKMIYNGSSCPYAQRGYYPGGKTKRNVIGFGLVTSKIHHHPVLCRAIPGSYNDTQTLRDTVNHLKGFGYKHLTLILDRGMISEKNVKFALGAEYDMIGIVPETNNAVWECFQKWPREKIEQPKFVVARPSGSTAYAREWTAPVLGQKKMKVVMVSDPVRAVEERVGRDLLLWELEQTPSKERVQEIRRSLKHLTRPKKGRRGFELDEAKVKEEEMGYGRYLMFSTDMKMKADEIFSVYFQKDVIEKAFRTMKGALSAGPIRYRRKDRIDAYTTVLYIAYLLWSRAERRLRKKYPSMTISEVLRTVEEVSLIQFRSKKLIRKWTTQLTKKQEELLSHLGATQYLPHP
ncbi:MAG: transposase, partial [Thermoplasmata archaeon]